MTDTSKEAVKAMFENLRAGAASLAFETAPYNSDIIRALEERDAEAAALIRALEARAEASEARVKALEEALGFYATEGGYDERFVTLPCECCSEWVASEVLEDKGRRARAALEPKP
jgi:hypothetical protein